MGLHNLSEENKRMSKELFYRELVIALPKNANADGHDDSAYFASKVKKVNDSKELKKLCIEFSAILPYSTSKAFTPEVKLENIAIAEIQDYMIESEKRMVAEIVKNKNIGR